MNGIAKWFLQSKTVWLNLLGPVFAWLAAKGITVDPDTQQMIIAGLMALANIIFRLVFSRGPVTLTPTAAKVMNFKNGIPPQ